MKNLILPFLLILTLVFSCRSENDETLERKVASYDVYVGGVDEFDACYWKNGQKISLPGGENLQGTYVKVENNGDVYMLANNIEKLGGNHTIPAWYFWKNGVKYNVANYLNVAPNTLNIQDNLQIWNNLTIHNGDIYFSGIIKNPSPTSSIDIFQLCYWKNGVKTVLESFSTANPATVGCIGFYNNEMYITTRKNFNYNSGSPTWDLGYFKNNIYHYIQSNLNSKYFLSDNFGMYLVAENQSFINNIFVKNLITGNNLTLPTNVTQTNITNMVLDNSDKYYIGNNFYFKNNNLIQISDPNNFNKIGLFLAKDQNIYMSRYNTDTGGKSVKFYINGVEILSLQDITRGCFNSIFVVQN
ncbi:hypothetical protein [Chryseobacterium chendengshani]|uniref:hypothetical protein n=1 Tax=Chryseobacterium sp. LJ756 TaxID=2864113 RepID=UPI001C63E2E6|nr:hypothetical protein [Chryseobacterium sp. LJ756]MBW7676460.1 hypothetical protein [Chryseobacterium sp. LJ756]